MTGTFSAPLAARGTPWRSSEWWRPFVAVVKSGDSEFEKHGLSGPPNHHQPRRAELILPKATPLFHLNLSTLDCLPPSPTITTAPPSKKHPVAVVEEPVAKK